MTVACMFCAGSFCSSISPSPQLLALSRILLGFAVGGSSQVTPMYIAELAPRAGAEARHLVQSVHRCGHPGGQHRRFHAARCVDVAMDDRRRHVSGMICSVACWLPESPRWLAENISIDAARKVLERVRENPAGIDYEIGEIREVVLEGGSGRRRAGACCRSVDTASGRGSFRCRGVYAAWGTGDDDLLHADVLRVQDSASQRLCSAVSACPSSL